MVNEGEGMVWCVRAEEAELENRSEENRFRLSHPVSLHWGALEYSGLSLRNPILMRRRSMRPFSYSFRR